MRLKSVDTEQLMLVQCRDGCLLYTSEHKGLEELILKHNEEKKYLAAICAAPTVFGGMGILKGKKAICYPAVSYTHLYGYFQSEKGVHRLVRISPFNSAGKRQTSFASCDVIPDIEDDIDIELNDDDLRIDTYRSSGAGGQHINKTSSAVRITHLPTGIVVQCQNERSQLFNKDKAMQMLKAKLYLLKKQEQEEKVSGIRGEVQDINFGSQIRSYILHPYNLVKDHRTGEETGNVSAVLDGELDPFINAYLKQRSNNG